MSYIPKSSHLPFHTTEDGFRVWESEEREGHFICNSPGYLTYRGDLVGVGRFIERCRRLFPAS